MCIRDSLKTADLEIDHLSFKNVEAFSSVGEIEINKTIIDSGNLSTNTGDLYIEDSEISNTKMNVNTGDTNISLANYHLSIYPNKEAKTPLQLKTSDTDSLTIKNDIGDVVIK